VGGRAERDREAHRPKPQGFCKVDITKREGYGMDERKMRAMIGALKLDVLEAFLHDEPRGNEADAISAWFDALAESKDVMVIEAEVEHTPSFTKLIYRGPGSIGYDYLLISGHHGTSGPYVLFGVPKPKEEKDE